MMRMIGLVVALGAFGTLTLAAPRPADKSDAPIYFPTVVGDRWVMSISGPGQERVTNREEATAVSKKGGVTTITVARLKEDGSKEDEYTVEASAEGVCVVAADGKKYEQPTWLIKSPSKPGSTWEHKVSDGRGESVTYVYKVIGEETVETPAGTFKAVRFDIVAPAAATGHSEWFAPGRGRVQQVSDSVTAKLKSFTQDKQ